MVKKNQQKNLGNQSNLRIHPFNFLKSWRSLPAYELIGYVFMFSGIQLLAYQLQLFSPSFVIDFFSCIIALYTGFFAALIWNDITDSDIDRIVHPTRPIPSDRISPTRFFCIGVILAILTLLFSFIVNLYFFIAVIFLAIFVTIHNKYLKRKMHIPAYSEIFTPIQWAMVPVLCFLSMRNFSIFPLIYLVLFTYFSISSHDIVEGIHDFKGDKKSGVQTYAVSFGVQKAVFISLIWFVLSGIFAVFLFIYSFVSILFLVLFFILFVYTAYSYVTFIKKIRFDSVLGEKQSMILGRKGYNYFLFTYIIIFFDVVIKYYLSGFFLI